VTINANETIYDQRSSVGGEKRDSSTMRTQQPRVTSATRLELKTSSAGGRNGIMCPPH